MRFSLVLVLILIGSSSEAQTARRSVALTFDDLPKAFDSGNLADARRTTSEILAALKRHRAPAIGFVNERQLHVPGEMDARIAILDLWVQAGLTLGNHTFSHPDLQTTPLPQYEDDFIHGEVITRRLMQKAGPYQLYFRHPFTHTGPTKEVRAAFEEFLKTRGYKIAPFTVENSDYIFNKLYVEARKANDQPLSTRIRAAYLEHNDAVFGFIEGLSREMFGREIMQVLLIHANDLNADCMDEMLKRMETRGYEFKTLDRALEDKAYETRDDFVGRMGPSWLHRWSVSLGLRMKLDQEPDPPNWVMEMYKKSR
jgi:peptidoglycan/xylan/chitin deacetylase (PgdA/CDA1 family)